MAVAQGRGVSSGSRRREVTIRSGWVRLGCGVDGEYKKERKKINSRT